MTVEGLKQFIAAQVSYGFFSSFFVWTFDILLVFIPVVLSAPCLFLTMQEQSAFEKNKINPNNSGKLRMS